MMVINLVAGAAVLAWSSAFIWMSLKMRRGFRRARAKEIQGAYDASLNSEGSLLRLMTDNPSYAPAAIRLAEILLERRLWDQADERGKSLRVNFPKDPAAYMIGVKVLLAKGEIDAAETQAALAVKRFPSFAPAFIEFSDIARRREDWHEVALRWSRTRQHFPQLALAHLWEGKAYIELGDLDAADKIFEAALKSLDTSGQRAIVIQYAEIANKRDDKREAARRWEMVRQLIERSPIAYLRGSEALRECGCNAEANRLLDEGLFLFPTNPELVQTKKVREQNEKANQRGDV